MSTTTTSDKKKPLAYRLPKTVRPLAYDIEIAADPGRPEFSGRVRMDLVMAEAGEQIIMHARELQLTDARYTPEGSARGGAPEAVERSVALVIELDAERQIVTFRLSPGAGAASDATFAPGKGRLEVAFSGKLNPSMHGIYLASDGSSQVGGEAASLVGRAVCTQCEATDARAIFPCFDEPEFKARLRWTIQAPAGTLALSNGALAEVTPAQDKSGGQIYRFHETRPVSSYLAALCIGDFEGSPETVVSGTPLRVYAMRGKLGQTRFAHDFTERLLPFYENYFGIPYPYAKYDQVAVPGFDAGAMENIGLVLFRQNLLLMDPTTASWRQEKIIAKVIAHEFAHMWFGNWVTMRWWDDLWLNEAFAEWMAHKATQATAPSYLVWNDFQDDKNRALIDDALPTTHPIWTPVETPDEAIEMFDAITYQKGCAVMRMLENFLGEGAFREGLRSYMKAYGESNATGPDLWQKLAEASGLPVGEVMQSWVAQSGFPLIDVSFVAPGVATGVAAAAQAGDGGGVRLALRQRRFFSSPRDSKADNDQRWHVPLILRYEDDTGLREHRFILSERSAEVTLPTQGALRWCYANADEVGFYRTNPDAEVLAGLLAGGLDRLSPVEQMGLLEDQWALVRNATGTIEPFLDLIERLSVVREHNVLRAVVDRLYSLDLLLKDTGERGARLAFRRFVGGLFGAQLEQLGYVVAPGDAQNDIQRRALLVSALTNLARVPEAIARSEEMASQEQADPRAVDANLAGVFVGVAAKFGDHARYESFVRTYLGRRTEGATPQETLRYLYSLSNFRREGLVERTLELIKDGTIPQESIGVVLGQLLAQRHAQEQTWQHLKAGWGDLRDRIGDMGLSRLVEAVGHLRPLHREDIVTFFRDNPPRGADRALARALEAMDQREELRQRVTPGLLRRFAAT